VRRGRGALIPGAQAWAGGDGEVGALLLHGFTGNPWSMRPLAEALAADGLAVELPRLPGHGSRWQELQRTDWRDWAGEALSALARLRARTRARVVVGQSMGATLTLQLARIHADDLAGIVLINPALSRTDPALRLLPVLKWLLPTVGGIGNDIAKAGADERAYRRVPLRALASLLDLQRDVQRHLGEVTLPTLVFTARSDHVVDPGNSATVIAGIAATDKAQVWLERSYHVATLDQDLAMIAAATAEFARRVSTPPPPAPGCVG
jgi:carboxylesterase